MKKTLLATAISGATLAMVASGAQASNIYDQDGRTLGIDGRVGVAVTQTTSGNSDFVSAGSRLNLRAAHQVSPDTRAFGHVEWRFNAAEQNSDGFSEVRHSWIGVEDARFGTVMAGNFDNVYTTQVFGPFNYYAMTGGYGFTGMATNARGDSVAYMTPSLEGFQAFVAAKHYSQADLVNANSSDVLTSGGVKYAIDGFEIAAGWTEAFDAAGDSDHHAGVRVSYAFNDMITGRMGFEDRRVEDLETFGIGFTANVTPQLALAGDYYYQDEDSGSRNEFAAGAYYRIFSNFDVFSEVYDQDIDGNSTQVFAGARYFF